MDMANLFGVMVKNMKEIGRIIKCMVMVSLNGQMEDHIKDIIIIMRKMEKESLLLMKIQDTKEDGKMVNNMAMVF
jgi:hypothetical protein